MNYSFHPEAKEEFFEAINYFEERGSYNNRGHAIE
jgi:hypothetical protein